MRTRLVPAVERERLPWGFCPLRDITGWRPLVRDSQTSLRSVLGVSRAFDGFLRHSACRFVSPCSHVQGSLFRGFAPSEAVPSRRRPVPSCRFLPTRCLTVACRAPRICQPPSGLALHRDPLCRRRGLAAVFTRSPPEFLLLQVLSPPTLVAPSRSLRS